MDSSNLDSLLDDLQSSVSPPPGNGPLCPPPGPNALNATLQLHAPLLTHSHPSAFSNMAGTTTGYREVRREMTTQATGQLPSTTREYQIEYLSPANSTTVPEERAASPAVLNSEFMNGVDTLGNMSSMQKVMSYEYKTSSSNAALLRDASDTLSQARAIGNVQQQQQQLQHSGHHSHGAHSNMQELDTLLDDLNSTQRGGLGSSREYQITTSTVRDGYESTPVLARSEHVSRSSQRYSPAHHTTTTSSSLDRATGMNSTMRDVKYSSSSSTSRIGGAPSPSPVRREVPSSPSANRHVTHHETYRYETKGTGGSSAVQSTTRYRDASPPRDRVRPPSPGMGLPDYPATGAAKVSTLVREYERRASREEQDAAAANFMRRSPSPARKKMVSSTTTYNSYSSTTNSGRRTPPQPRTPPPHRSPSPVSFPMPPEPLAGFTYRRDETSYSSSATGVGSGRPRSRSRSPPLQPFPTGSRTVHTYQMDRVDRTHREPVLQPRPFPTPSPTPHEDQRPPKELNELMSSFTETDMGHTSVRQHAMDLEQRVQRQQQPPASPPTPPPARKHVEVQEPPATRNVAGPPVYYPPGVEMFQHSEASMEQRAGGGYKGKAQAKYEYKMKQRSKESSKTGKALVPVCLPLCCAMPCEIM